MSGLIYHQIEAELRADDPVSLGDHKGAAIRGALLGALRRHYCIDPASQDRAGHEQSCPVCGWISGVDPGAERGQNVPRAYVIKPPLDTRNDYAAGDVVSFGLGLIGPTDGVYPYLLSSISQMGAEGLGYKLRGKRGRLELVALWAVNPITRERCSLLDADSGRLSARPVLPVTHEIVSSAAARWPDDRITLRFRTPTRLIEDGGLLKSAQFRPVFHRLIDRVTLLWKRYGHGSLPVDREGLIQQAAMVEMVSENIHWEEVSSRSGRTGRKVPISGLMGEVTYCGELKSYIPWLLWGTCVGVGKNTVKGDGWYELLP